MKKTVLMILVLALLVSTFLTGGSSAEETEAWNIQVTLTKVGSIDAELLKRASFYSNGIRVMTDDNKYQLLNYQGVNALGESYDRVQSFGRDTWLVYQADKGVNNCGLVKGDGTVLIPVSAAIIKEISDSNESHRFLEVIYATEEVSNEKDAYLFKTEKFAAISPEAGDKLYKGYSLFFDLEKNQFVGDLKREDTAEAYSISVFGDKLYFDRRNVLYDANGAVVKELSNSDYINRGFLFERGDDGLCSVYNSDLEKVATLQEQPDGVYFGGQLFAFRDYDTDLTTIRDREGAQVGDLPFEYAPYECGSSLYGHDADDHYLVMDRTGKTLIDAEAGVTYVDEEPFGFLRLNFADDTEGLLYPDGTIVKAEEQSNLLLTESRGEGVAVLVLKDKAFSLEFAEDNGCDNTLYSNSMAPVFYAGMKDGVATLFNIVNGEALLRSDYDGAYEAFHYANGYIYARQEDAYDIYKVDISH